MRHCKILFAFLLAIRMLSGIRASAQAYVNENQSTYIYVDANYGNDSNSGAWGHPFKTIQAGFNRADANNVNWVGSRIIVEPGVYRESVYISNYRSTSAPITLQAAVTGTAAAMLADQALRKAGAATAVIGSFAAAFITYEVLLYAMTPWRSGGDFAMPVVLYILYVNAIAFGGLLILQIGAMAVGFAARPTAASP